MVTEISPVSELPNDISVLQAAATGEGFDFVERLVHDWADGSNRFDRPGERLLSARRSDQLVAVGGINVDPYLDVPDVGRIRHLYVLPDQRGSGLGRQMVRLLVRHAEGRFTRVRLRAGPPEASGFYERMGFTPISEANATHALELRRHDVG